MLFVFVQTFFIMPQIQLNLLSLDTIQKENVSHNRMGNDDWLLCH